MRIFDFGKIADTIESELDLQGMMDLGLRIAKDASPGMVIALTGDLGAGKTTLSKAIANGLGICEAVTSPTFTIVNEYNSGRMPFYHFDAYRLEGIAGEVLEMEDVGFDDYFYGEGLCVVEWADLIRSLMPQDAVWINLSYAENDELRRITFGK